MARPLTREELLALKDGTVLWAVLIRTEFLDVPDLRKVVVRGPPKCLANGEIIVNPNEVFDLNCNFSTTWRKFYKNYWDAYRAMRKQDGKTSNK